jgi:F-type H+-transporting ATPase subunit a
MNISVAPETLFTAAGFPITNSLLLSAVAFIFTTVFLIFVGRRVAKRSRKIYDEWAKTRPASEEFGTIARTDSKFARELETDEEVFAKTGFFTRLATWTIEGLYTTVKQVVPDADFAKKVAPFTISIFFFVIFNYYFGILPFVGEVFTLHHAPLFRGGAADLNFTFMLAILTIVMVQVYAFRALGFRGNMKRYFVNPFRDPIGSFGGILELIGEFSRMLALSFRLFGNCVAGEILLIVAAYLAKNASFAVLPFLYIFELFIGGIQAYIFFMLASTFIGLAVQHTDHSSELIAADDTIS